MSENHSDGEARGGAEAENLTSALTPTKPAPPTIPFDTLSNGDVLSTERVQEVLDTNMAMIHVSGGAQWYTYS